MQYFIISVATFLVSILALLSGFGVGTILVPIFAIFFPIPMAISSVAIIHLLNNLFKVVLVGKFANRNVVIKFGIPAAITSIAGALTLSYFVKFPPLFSYKIYSLEMNVTIIGLVLGTLIVISSLFELIPKFSTFSISSKYIVLGGMLSGFFGGLMGNQGIMRAAFLIKVGLNQAQYIGTSAVCSIIVDTSRIFVYGWAIYSQIFGNMNGIALPLIITCLVSFLGSYVGSKLMNKITSKNLQLLVGYMLLILGFGIMLGTGKS